MNPWLLLLVWVWPLALAALTGARTLSGISRRPLAAIAAPLWWLPAIGALPGLAAALLVPLGSRLELPWLFLGTTLGLDATGRVYLLFTAILWLAAGVYAAFSLRGQVHGGRFGTFFLLAMAGNLWLIVGQDLLSFYAGFAMMGLASYGLVIHNGDPDALRAGKVYLVMALCGEVTLFAALVMIASHAGTLVPTSAQLVGLDGLAIGLLLVGLGVKAGMVPLHLWLPLAHPAAPIAASAVLSGTMIKVAILGWLRFLPVGAVALADWGAWLSAAGLLTMFFALPIGMTQSDPKVILAYSSVSKMGLLMLLLGLILSDPALAPVGIAAITLYAAHHALVKGGLFLGVGLRKSAAIAQPLVLGGLVILALALAGAPLTSGAVTKYGVKPLLDAAHWTWLAAAVALSAVATTLLMARFLWVSVRTEPHPRPGYAWPGAAWAVLITLVLLFPFLLGKPAAWLTNAATLGAGIGIAVVIGALAVRYPSGFQRLIGSIPPGDLLVLAAPLLRILVWLGRTLWRPWSRLYDGLERAATAVYSLIFDQPVGDTEQRLREWPVAGSLWLGLTAMLFLFVIAGTPGPSGTPSRASLEAATTAQTESAAPVDPLVMPGEASADRAEQPDSAPARETDGADMASATDVSEVERMGVASDGGESLDMADEDEPDRARSGDVPLCDPAVPFVFASHTDPADVIALERCVRDAETGALRLLESPPLTNRLVRLVQRNLQGLGFDPGPIDGMIGPNTRRAIRAFQQAEGMRPAGGIGFELLERLKPRPD